MATGYDKFGKFVRLKLVDEIVEVISAGATEITIKFSGHQLRVKPHEVSRMTPEEAASRASDGVRETKEQIPKTKKDSEFDTERVHIFKSNKGSHKAKDSESRLTHSR